MLKVMRKHAKYFYVLFFIVIITFVFWGVGTVDKTGMIEKAAEVGPYKILADDYIDTYERYVRFYREIYKEKFSEEMQKELKRKVLESMVDDKVLLIAAKDAGIVVSDEELQDSISREPAFQKNGVFDHDMYINRLMLNRITPEYYENMKRQELIVEKMRRLIESSADANAFTINLPENSGNDKSDDMLNQVLSRDIKARAVKSFIEGYKKNIKNITINQKFLE